MDYKQFTQQLASNTQGTTGRVEEMIDAFASVLADVAKNQGSVAIPSFGTFETVKTEESIITDRVSGKRIMLPPQISFKFNPAAMLRKKMIEGHE